MDIFGKLVEKIIAQQETIIGPVALEQAKKVVGLNINWPKHEVTIEGNKTDIVEKLVEQYQGLFGQASVEACKEAVRGIISEVPQNQVPALLR